MFMNYIYKNLLPFFLWYEITLKLLKKSTDYMSKIVDGDIESNPGPDFDKIVTCSFHQGDMEFGQTACIQCACNYLFAIAWPTTRKVTIMY